MKNLKQIARATTLTGIIILTTVTANAGLLMSDRSSAASSSTEPCSEANAVTSIIDSALAAVGATDEGTFCGIIVD